MDVEIARYALDRVPLSIILDDSTLLLNLNYFFIRDRNLADGENRRWQDVPVVHPESFTREFAEWCSNTGSGANTASCPVRRHWGVSMRVRRF